MASSLFALEAPPDNAAAGDGDAATAGPLVKLVGHLATQDTLPAHDCAELARTTLSYGQREQSASKPAPEGPIRDGLAAVDAGERLDPKAADWKQLREDLEKLLKKPEQQQNQSQQNKDQQKQDQQKQDQQQDQSQQKQDQNQSEQKSDQQQKQPQSGEKKQEQKNAADQKQDRSKPDQSSSDSSSQGEKKDQPQKPESAFGDMSKPEEKSSQPKPQPARGETQKVGGTPSKPDPERLENPELAQQLQKLDQIRSEDSPAKLFQIMEGDKKTPAAKGKDW
jgi:Ca-activated chloride channel family protein